MVSRFRCPLLRNIRVPVLPQTVAAQGGHFACSRHVGIGVVCVVQLDAETFGHQLQLVGRDLRIGG